MSISLRYDEGCAPIYKTELSAGADVVARLKTIIYAGQTRIISTGVYIDLDSTRFLDTPLEIQMRIRSSLALKGLSIPNGVGTIDLDYPDEIGFIVHNYSRDNIILEQYSRVGQLVLTPIDRFDNIEVSNAVRVGGYGSTDADDGSTDV